MRPGERRRAKDRGEPSRFCARPANWRRLGALAVLVLLLSAGVTGCAHVPPQLVMPRLALADDRFVPTVEGVTGAPLTDRNSVQILLNGNEIFPAQLAAIRGARKTISYAQYFFEDGPIAEELADALAAKCREGVAVHVLLDGFGTLTMPTQHRDTMTDSGCHVATFRPLTNLIFGRTNNRNHRRILVVDGEIGFTGGSGVSWRWMGDGRTEEHWRDTDARVEGPAVQYLQSAFVDTWLEATNELLGGEAYFPEPVARGNARVQVVRSSPSQGSAAMYRMFLLALSSARRYIYITNPYFVPDARMIQVLVDAAHRGVEVVVLLPGKIDNNIVRQASRRELGRLLQAGVSVYEYQVALLHAKTMVIDGLWATVGSTNFDNRSLALNEELNLGIYSRDVAARLERIFADDLSHSRKLTYEDWKHRGFKARILELMALPLREQL